MKKRNRIKSKGTKIPVPSQTNKEPQNKEIPKNKYYEDDGYNDFWKSILDYSKSIKIKSKQ
jgi:hypothetical protein